MAVCCGGADKVIGVRDGSPLWWERHGSWSVRLEGLSGNRESLFIYIQEAKRENRK